MYSLYLQSCVISTMCHLQILLYQWSFFLTGFMSFLVNPCSPPPLTGVLTKQTRDIKSVCICSLGKQEIHLRDIQSGITYFPDQAEALRRDHASLSVNQKPEPVGAHPGELLSAFEHAKKLWSQLLYTGPNHSNQPATEALLPSNCLSLISSISNQGWPQQDGKQAAGTTVVSGGMWLRAGTFAPCCNTSLQSAVQHQGRSGVPADQHVNQEAEIIILC